METTSTFERWFAEILGQTEFEVEHLLHKREAIHFLIAWSLFESRCFEGFLKVEKIKAFSERVASSNSFDELALVAHARHFHERYQDKSHFKRLMHAQACPELQTLLKREYPLLSSAEMLFLCVFVVYRFRNNIFHGNKGVRSWLQYEEQISRCTQIMQAMISHAEHIQCVLKLAKAA